jgi:hypothetical protein
MSRIPGIYPISVTALAGLAAWAAYDFGKGPGAAERMLASRPKPAVAKQTTATTPGRGEKTALDLPAEIDGMTRQDLSQQPMWSQLAAWEKIRSLTLPEVKEAMELIVATKGKAPTDTLKSMLYARWAELDPEEAMVAVAANSGEIDFSAPGRFALWTWLQRDTAAARDWANKNPELAKQLSVHAMLSDLLANETPEAAMEKAALLGKEVLQCTLTDLSTKMAMDEESHAEFMDLLEKFPADQRQKMLEHFALTWCASDPAKGLAGLKDLIPDEGARNKLRDRTLDRWGRSQPAETLAWMDSHPQDAAIGKQAFVWRGWVEKRPGDALAWLESHGEDVVLAETIVRHLQSHGANDPFSRAASAQRQAEGLRRSYQVWSRAKPEEAAKWLATADPKIAATLRTPAPAAQ